MGSPPPRGGALVIGFAETLLDRLGAVCKDGPFLSRGRSPAGTPAGGFGLCDRSAGEPVLAHFRREKI